MYRFFDGKLGGFTRLIYTIDPSSEFAPYTELQVGDYISLPPDAHDFDQEVWVIKERVVWPDQIEYICERYIWED